MDGIPNAVYVGNLIGVEFHDDKEERDSDDNSVIENVKTTWKVRQVVVLKETEDGNGCIHLIPDVHATPRPKPKV